MNKYIIIISVWFVISLVTLFLFRFIPGKMKRISDPQSKNSLFVILIFLGIPLLMISILTPLVFIIGDKNIDLIYEIIWVGLCLFFAVYFVLKQRSR